MITVLGLGFVGLTTAVGFSEKGLKVYGYDINRDKTKAIGEGKLPFFEKDLDIFLKKNLDNKNLVITNDLEESLENSQVVFLCVGTPSDDSGKADLKYIFSAIDLILEKNSSKKFLTIIIKSTIPPSTTSVDITQYIEQKGLVIGRDIGLANNPEFLREGYAWDDFINPDRIVVGVSDEKGREILSNIYGKFSCQLHIVSLNEAEFIKYLSNTTLSTLISFANEMSIVAAKIGEIDISRAFRILKQDKRWFGNPASMAAYLHPGCGFGGYCLPKDTQAMVAKSKEYGFAPTILESVIKTNDYVKDHSVERIINISSSSQDRIGILGLAFKPDSDDVRDTPAASIIRRLIAKGYKNISAYDPISNDIFKLSYPDIDILKYHNKLEDLLDNSDILVLVTSWGEFKKIKLNSSQKFIDLRYQN